MASSYEYVRPKLYAKQEQAIFAPERYAIVEASTKSGKTHGCILWISEQAMQGKSGQTYWWVAPVYAQAKIAYRRLKRAIPRSVPMIANDTELTLTWPNGAINAYKSAEHPDALYGDDVYAAVVDEASRVREESWHAIRSTLTATRGPVRIIGNVKGRRNWFYNMARRAESGDAEMHYARITWKDAVEAGVLDAREIDDARRQLPEAVFRELYEAEPSDDGGNPFGSAAIKACILPLVDQPIVAWGWDLAKSVDWTVGIGLDKLGRTVRFERFQASWEDTITRIVEVTKGAPALVDSTGVGDPILERLQRAGGNFEGYQFNASSKQKLMEGLAVAIQKNQVWFPEGTIVSELESYEYEFTRTGVRYSAPEGMHDDCVCALALAVQRLGAGGRWLIG